jgi:hypothetical protein
MLWSRLVVVGAFDVNYDCASFLFCGGPGGGFRGGLGFEGLCFDSAVMRLE